MKIAEYGIVTEEDEKAFESLVNHWIKKGFQPLGGVSVVLDHHVTVYHVFYTQAMVKYEKGELDEMS